MSHRGKKKLLFFLKLAVSVGLIVYLCSIVDWARAINTVGSADRVILVMVPFLLFGRLGFAAFRWQLILADSNVVFSFGQAYVGYLIGSFYNLLLPGVTGGDAVRIGRSVKQTGCQLGTATVGVLLERISGILALLVIALSSWLFFPEVLLRLMGVGETLVIKVIAAGGIALIAGAMMVRRVWLRLFQPGKKGKVWSFVGAGVQTLCGLKWSVLGSVLILTILFQAADIIVVFLLSKAMGLSVPLSGFFAVMPLVYLAIMLPVSLGGLGVREGALAFLLVRFGVAASDAVTLSFLVYLSRFVTAGSGGLFQLRETVAASMRNVRSH